MKRQFLAVFLLAVNIGLAAVWHNRQWFGKYI